MKQHTTLLVAFVLAMTSSFTAYGGNNSTSKTMSETAIGTTKADAMNEAIESLDTKCRLQTSQRYETELQNVDTTCSSIESNPKSLYQSSFKYECVAVGMCVATERNY